MSQRSRVILISVLSVILGVVCLLTGRSLYKSVPARGADPTPVPTVVAYDPTKAEGTAENPFTILEIVPNYSYAQIGYLIDGQEPVNVYGTDGILANAQAGYQGAYDYLELLTEFTVSGPRGDLSGDGGSVSTTIYAFADEKANYPEVAADAWTQSTETLERVTGYYTIATSDQLANTGLMKYKLEKKTTTNASDTSGIDGKVYEVEAVWTGFEYAGNGGYNREQINSSGRHRLAEGQSGVNLSSYSSYSTGGGNKTYYYYSDSSGKYIYYNGYMYYASNNGRYAKSYSEGYYVYNMVQAGTSAPANNAETYYIYNGALGYEDNKAYLDGVYELGNSILIEEVAYNYVETAEEYYYTYTVEVEEETGEVFVFEDEKTSGVEYEERGTTSRAGSYYAVTNAIRTDSAIQKYEYALMLKTEAAALGWIESDWSGKGLDGEEYSKDLLVGFREATTAEKNDSSIDKYEKLATTETDKIVGSPVALGTYNFVSGGDEYVEKPDGWTGETYNCDVTYVSAATFSNNQFTTSEDINNLWFVTFSTSGSGKTYTTKSVQSPSVQIDQNNMFFYQQSGSTYFSLIGTTNNYTGYTGSQSTQNYRLVTFVADTSGKYYVTGATKYTEISNTINQKISSMLYTKTEVYTKATGTTGQYIKATDRYEYDATGNGSYIYYDGNLYTKASDGDYVAEYEFRVKADGEGKYIYWLRPVTQTYVDANSGTTFYYWKGLTYEYNKIYKKNASYKSQVIEAANWKLVDTRIESYFAEKVVDPDAPEVVIPTDTVTITHSNVFLKNVMNFAYQDNDPTKPLELDRFEFAGWYTEPECINRYDFENAVLRADITLYAKWLPKTSDDNDFVSEQYKKTYTVKFYAKATDEAESCIVENFNADLELSKVTYVPVYAKEEGDTKDYVFLGWSTAENGTVVTEIAYADGVAAGVVKLYPVWKVMDVTDEEALAAEETYTVEFYVTKDDATSVVKTLEVYENGYIQPEEGVTLTDKYLAAMASFTPEAQTGKKFVGWYAKENPVFGTDIPYTFDKAVTEDVKLYACWIEDEEEVWKNTKLTITFDGNVASVEALLLDKDAQVVEEDSLCPPISYAAFSDGELAEVKPVAVNKTPRLQGNVQYKASRYNIEVKTVLPSELNSLSADELDELLNKADMIVVSNSNNHTDYGDIFSSYGNKRGGTSGYTASNDLNFRVATALMKKSMEAGSAPILLDKTLLDYRSNENTARLNAYKLFVMLQAMDTSMFYDSFLKSNATSGAESDLWARIESDGTYNSSTRWYFSTFITALGLSDSDKIYYGIDKDVNLSAYPISLTNHCFVYSGEMFKNGTEFTKNVVAEDEFYTAKLFDYFDGTKAATDNKYAPADAVNYMVFGYQPESGLNETTAFLEIQPTQSYESLKFWYLYVKKFMPNYCGKLVISRGNTTEQYFYLGTAEADNYTNTLTIEQMASTEFVGKLCDLSGDYRMIYLGLRQVNLLEASTLTWQERYEDGILKNSSGDFYAYYHVGKVITLSYDDFQGQLSLDGYSDYIEQYCYPGNDFTTVKCEELLEFCKSAELPVVLSSDFFDGDAIDTNLIDSSTYLYQTLVYGRVYATEEAQTGLKDLPSCFTYGDAADEAGLKELLNQPNLRMVYASDSDMPPQYTVTYTEDGDVAGVSGYLNPNHETERVLSYTFYLQGDPDAEYDIRMFIDMNADGKYTEATEKLDSLIIYDNTRGRYLSKYDSMTAGHNYTVKRSINDYVGVLPWKLEVYEKTNPAVHYAITGMTAIKTTKLTDEANKVYEKEKLKILQICSGTDTTVYMPSIQDITDALGGEQDGDGKLYADYTFDDFTDAQKTLIKNKMNTLGTSGVTYMFWEYLANLEDFDVEITRIGESYNDYNGGYLKDLYAAISADPLYLEQYNMLILGFADCYNDITDEKTLRAIEDFIASGKSVLFTHDTTSFNNLSVNGIDANGVERSHSGTIWGYYINRYFRNIVGMDRYGATLIYDHDGDNHDEELENKDKVYLAGTEQSQYVTATDTTLSGSPEKALVHGYSRWELWKHNGFYNATTTYASKVNDGQLTKYPYAVGDNIRVATTHSQYYQLDLEADDIVVWYCLSGDYFNDYYNDATNYYYIYNKGNITYSGVGHDGNLTDDEAKLFVNTMVAAYAASADATAPQIINFDRTTGTDKIDYLYVDYDTVFPELAIGEGVDGTVTKDAEGNVTSNQTKEVNFKLTENSIVTNKLMTMYVYKSTNAIAPYTYETLPLEMEISKYTSENDTEVVSAIPVFIVTEGGTYGDDGEYKYEPGQILAVDDNIIRGSGSSAYVSVGGKASETFTLIEKTDTNGYYASDEEEEVAVHPQTGVDASGEPTYSTTDYIKGRIFMAPVVEAGEEYVFCAPIAGLVDKDMIPYMLHVNLRYGKRQDKSKDGYKEISIVRRGLFNLD